MLSVAAGLISSVGAYAIGSGIRQRRNEPLAPDTIRNALDRPRVQRDYQSHFAAHDPMNSLKSFTEKRRMIRQGQARSGARIPPKIIRFGVNDSVLQSMNLNQAEARDIQRFNDGYMDDDLSSRLGPDVPGQYARHTIQQQIRISRRPGTYRNQLWGSKYSTNGK